MALDDSRINKLTSLIKDSFRVRPNHDPIYVDTGNHIGRLASGQHQVVFGRRGSGKSCLLVHYHRARAKSDNVLSIYIDADEVKTLPYPDLLIRLLLSIGEGLRKSTSSRLDRLLRRGSSKVGGELMVLRALLDQADSAQVSDEIEARSSISAKVNLGGGGSKVGGGVSEEERARRTTQYTASKVDTLERHLQDYKAVLADAIASSEFHHAAIIVDDFYLIDQKWQPNVIDYIHRLVRGTDLYVKLGTVRHRTALVRYVDGQTIGVELAQDVEEINLDQTFEDVDATRRYLAGMLDSMAVKAGLHNFCQTFFSEDGLLALTLASGGVPRDFLNIFVEAVDAARDMKSARWLTPTAVYRGAGRVSYRTKLSNLRDDVGADAQGLEKVFRDLTSFCLKEKKKTAFLVAQDDAAKYPHEHELIQQLMDFKLIHVIEPDTSAASGRPGRHEAYTLDFALFMEPRLRGIEHAEFWKVDEQRRRRGLRESPVYSLAQAHEVLAGGSTDSTESVIDEIQAEAGVEQSRLDGF